MTSDSAEKKYIVLRAFLEETPPCRWALIKELGRENAHGNVEISIPPLYLYCEDDTCNGYRWFKPDSNSTTLRPKARADIYLDFTCKNCGKRDKTYALIIIPDAQGLGRAYKFGEYPQFGPPVPSKTISLIGPDKELFFAGRRAESQGMGIGSFSYYRRVIENQKSRIFDEIIRVTKVLAPSDPVIEELELAKKETRFTKAVEAIKHALPQSLLINGHNPLTLLHNALSKGIHDHSDEQCLEFATSIRTVLIEFADRLGQALKNEKELTDAVKRLTQSGTPGQK